MRKFRDKSTPNPKLLTPQANQTPNHKPQTREAKPELFTPLRGLMTSWHHICFRFCCLFGCSKIPQTVSEGEHEVLLNNIIT